MEEIFGRVDANGNRAIRELFLAVPKKNGKSPLAAGIVCKLAFADSEPAAHVYGAASDREQAGIVFDYVAGMISRSPALKKRCKVNEGRKVVKIPYSRSFYSIVSAEVAHKHGYNSHGVVVDELHALPNFDLWDVLTFGSGAARTQPLHAGLTTAGITGESPVAEEKHETAVEILTGLRPCPDWFFPVVYAADKEADWRDETVWESCNPALGKFLSWETVRQEFEKAEQNIRNLNNFLRYRLNIWVQQVERWIDLDLWDGAAENLDLAALKEYPCWLAVDLSSTIDLTAVSLVFRLPGRKYKYKHWCWVPDELTGRDTVESDSYRRWIAAGDLRTCAGSEIRYDDIESHIVDLKKQGFKIQDLVYDPMYAGQLAQRLESKGFTAVQFVQRSYTHWNEACGEFEAALTAGRLVHDGNPVARWCANCVQIKRGPNGEVKLVKPDRNKTKKRIDPIVADVMATKGAMMQADRVSVYSRRETAVM